MAVHLPPTKVKGMPVVRYARLSAQSGHRCVAVVAQQENGTSLYDVHILTAPFADKPWEIEQTFADFNETGAIWKFREYEQGV